MPIFEYFCSKCDVELEELLTQTDEIKEYSDSFPCPICHERAPKIPSATNFNFKGGTPGNSGVHDLDFPILDKAVGRSAEQKWAKYRERKAARDEVRKQLGTNSISTIDNKVVPADPTTLQLREKALTTLKKAKEQNPK